MGSLRRSSRSAAFGLAVLAVAFAPGISTAAWLGYKNNTNAVVVIQATDLVIVSGQARPGRAGKVHTLYPGEMAWDPIAAPGPRLVSVYDKQKTTILHQDRVDCNKNDIFLSLQLLPMGAAGQPRLKFHATVLPSQAPGILPRGSMPPNLPTMPTQPPSQPGGRPMNPMSPTNPRPPS